MFDGQQINYQIYKKKLRFNLFTYKLLATKDKNILQL